MINCIACIKYVPEMNGASDSKVQRDVVQSIINPADMYAIEESVRIKEKYGGKAIGLCMGVPFAENTLRTSIAMGLDDVVLLSDKVFAGSDTLATSYVLAKGIGHIGTYDLILCGKQSTDGDTGQIGQEIASHLNLPCITNVVHISFSENMRSIFCRVLDDTGYVTLSVDLPALVCVLKGINEPRVPSISGVLKSRNISITRVDNDILGVDKTKCGLTGSATRVKRAVFHEFESRSSTDITNGFVARLDEMLSSSAKVSELELPIASNRHQNPSGSVWVVLEVVEGKITDNSLEILSKANALALSNNVELASLLIGTLSEITSKQLAAFGVDKLYTTNESLGRFNESVPLTIAAICKVFNPSVLLFGSTVWGKWVAPNVAVQLNTGLTADCIDLNFEQNSTNIIQTRIAFGGSILAEIVTPHSRPQIATIQKGVFNKTSYQADQPPQVVDVNFLIDRHNRIKTLAATLSDNELSGMINLSGARIVVAGGRGVGRENIPLLFRFARLVGGEVGASRVAVDAGWIDYKYQIGQTGTSVRPKLFLAFGISGASEHLIGMRNSGCIVAINTDSSAKIIPIADYRIIADCGYVLNSLIDHLERKADKNDIR